MFERGAWSPLRLRLVSTYAVPPTFAEDLIHCGSRVDRLMVRVRESDPQSPLQVVDCRDGGVVGNLHLQMITQFGKLALMSPYPSPLDEGRQYFLFDPQTCEIVQSVPIRSVRSLAWSENVLYVPYPGGLGTDLLLFADPFQVVAVHRPYCYPVGMSHGSVYLREAGTNAFLRATRQGAITRHEVGNASVPAILAFNCWGEACIVESSMGAWKISRLDANLRKRGVQVWVNSLQEPGQSLQDFIVSFKSNGLVRIWGRSEAQVFVDLDRGVALPPPSDRWPLDTNGMEDRDCRAGVAVSLHRMAGFSADSLGAGVTAVVVHERATGRRLVMSTWDFPGDRAAFRLLSGARLSYDGKFLALRSRGPPCTVWNFVVAPWEPRTAPLFPPGTRRAGHLLAALGLGGAMGAVCG